VALTRAACPPGEVISTPVSEEDVIENVGYFLASLPAEGRVALRLVLSSFEWLAIARFGRPFSSLDEERQSKWVLSWAYSNVAALRLVGRLLLTIVKPAHVRRRAVQAQMGHTAERLEKLDKTVPENPVVLPPERLFIGLEADKEVRCQVAIIGSGAGGALAATELAERGVDVVLIEEGKIFQRGTGKYEVAANLQRWYREGGATVSFGRPAIPIPLGMTVGGSTTINSGTCFRSPRSVLDGWERLGLPASREEIDPLYKRVEERLSVQLTPPELIGGSSHVVARGAEKLGIAHGPLHRNVKGCKMSAVCVFGCPTGAKQGMDVSAVPSALAHGATLYAGIRAQRILVEGGRAAGVVAIDRVTGAKLTVRADAVISACGTISGVPFLRASGLRSRHLGRKLTIHPATKIVALMPEEVNGWLDTPQGYGIHGLQDEGIMYEGAFVPPSYAAIAFPFAGRAFTTVMEQYPRLAMFGMMVQDEGSGRVYSGLNGRPITTYSMAKSDMEKTRRGLEVLSDIFFAAGAEKIFLPIAGIEEHDTMDSARAALSKPIDPWALELVGFHPLGTARMAASVLDGVVNPDLESWEIPGLYVMDGGILPTSLGVNPQMTIMAYTSRAAERLAAKFN